MAFIQRKSSKPSLRAWTDHNASAGKEKLFPWSFMTSCRMYFLVFARLFLVMGICSFSPSWYLMMCITQIPVSSLLIVVSRKRGKMVDQLSFGVGHPACRSFKHPNNASCRRDAISSWRACWSWVHPLCPTEGSKTCMTLVSISQMYTAHPSRRIAGM